MTAKCSTPYCRNKARKHKKICSTCDKRQWRKKYPMKAAFQTLRYNAKRRKKPFTITFEYFQQFCYETKYMAGKGRSMLSFTIDCKINALGYIPGNIQKLTKQDNSRKGIKVLNYDYRHPEHTTYG